MKTRTGTIFLTIAPFDVLIVQSKAASADWPARCAAECTIEEDSYLSGKHDLESFHFSVKYPISAVVWEPGVRLEKLKFSAIPKKVGPALKRSAKGIERSDQINAEAGY